jgi:hypothetical protein
LDAVKHYCRHYANLLYLQFISVKSDDWREKQQANKEMVICRNKLAYWMNHPNWTKEEVLVRVEELKRQWNTQGNTGAPHEGPESTNAGSHRQGQR